MKYKVFTDGSILRSKRILGMSYVIVTDDMYIKMNQFKSDGLSPTKAEVIAVGLACEYMLTNLELSSEDSVTFYIDGRNASLFLTGECRETLSMDDQRVSHSLNNFNLLQQKTDVSIKKVWAHNSTGLTGNKLADRLANYALVMD